MKSKPTLLRLCGLLALSLAPACIPSGATLPSGILTADGGSDVPDMAMPPVVRKCKDFDAFAGSELTCWDFTDDATRASVNDWAALQDVVTKSCWSASSTTPTVLQGGNASLPAKVECSLALTGNSSISGKGLDLGGVSSVTLAMSFQVAGFANPPTQSAFFVRPGLLPEIPLGTIGGAPKDFQSSALSFPVSIDQSANFQSSDLKLTFARSLLDQQIFIRSIAVLGAPRR